MPPWLETSRCSWRGWPWPGSSSTTGREPFSAHSGARAFTPKRSTSPTWPISDPGTFFAVLGGIIECFGGAAVGLGILGRLAAAALVGDMVIAMITVTFAYGIIGTSAGSGYELNLALAALALVVALMGTGRFSLDVLLRRLVSREAPPGPRPLG